MRKTWGKFGVDWHGWMWKSKSGKLEGLAIKSRLKPSEMDNWVRITITEAKPK